MKHLLWLMIGLGSSAGAQDAFTVYRTGDDGLAYMEEHMGGHRMILQVGPTSDTFLLKEKRNMLLDEQHAERPIMRQMGSRYRLSLTGSQDRRFYTLDTLVDAAIVDRTLAIGEGHMDASLLQVADGALADAQAAKIQSEVATLWGEEYPDLEAAVSITVDFLSEDLFAARYAIQNYDESDILTLALLYDRKKKEWIDLYQSLKDIDDLARDGLQLSSLYPYLSLAETGLIMSQDWDIINGWRQTVLPWAEVKAESKWLKSFIKSRKR